MKRVRNPGARKGFRDWLTRFIWGLSAGAMLAASPLAAEESGAVALAALEQRLLEAGQTSFRFDIRAVGAVQAALVGHARTGPDETAEIVADGSFAGSDAALRLTADGASMHGGNGTIGFDLGSPPALREGLLIGFVRMGLLHNLAMLSGGSPPDRTDGTVREWVQYSDVTLGPEESVAGVPARRFNFTVVVNGQPSAVAELWVDAKTGLPIRRVQVVSFPEGAMRVLEQYPDFNVGMDD
jgi:hypothetical protein